MLASNHQPRITDFQITPLWPVYNRSSAQGFTTALFSTSYQMAFTVKTRENVLKNSFPNLPPQAQKGSLSTALQYSTDQEAIIYRLDYTRGGITRSICRHRRLGHKRVLCSTVLLLDPSPRSLGSHPANDNSLNDGKAMICMWKFLICFIRYISRQRQVHFLNQDFQTQIKSLRCLAISFVLQISPWSTQERYPTDRHFSGERSRIFQKKTT